MIQMLILMLQINHLCLEYTFTFIPINAISGKSKIGYQWKIRQGLNVARFLVWPLPIRSLDY